MCTLVYIIVKIHTPLYNVEATLKKLIVVLNLSQTGNIYVLSFESELSPEYGNSL